ncbi:MAG TPA: sigma 54-interacting transcriptional regulator [Negativicutes bacterium]
MDDQILLQHLCKVLPAIARIAGGFATITNREGQRIKIVDSQGQELEQYHGTVYDIAREAGEKQVPIIGYSQIIAEAEAWALPIASYVLSCSNVEKIERDNKLRVALSKALPIIARIAGGEAVLFDQDGRRLESFDHNGRANNQFIGKVSQAAQQAMYTQQPVIGESTSVMGATAVRIPITDNYGLGFNNEVTVLQKQKLLDAVKKFQYAKYSLSDIIGESEAIQKCKTITQYIAKGVSSVLIYGATGTGKELFAQAIHNASDRCNKPFIAINCGALPSTLIEGNLFGYVDGSFTGAKKGGSTGIFEAADKGTVFLDEISELDWDLQSKLLRVIQEREVTRLGSTKPVPINVRIISSTNKNLRQLVAEKRFRDDLYYRVNVVELRVPTLKEREQDIELLTEYFLAKYNKVLGKMVINISPEVERFLHGYEWPGNVRELQNCIESALNMVPVDEQILQLYHLPAHFHQAPIDIASNQEHGSAMELAVILCKAEKNAIVAALQKEQNNRSRTAQRLGISLTTLWRKMREHALT